MLSPKQKVSEQKVKMTNFFISIEFLGTLFKSKIFQMLLNDSWLEMLPEKMGAETLHTRSHILYWKRIYGC
jgi:hypothetical protein